MGKINNFGDGISREFHMRLSDEEEESFRIKYRSRYGCKLIEILSENKQTNEQ
jgi:hypothetical protein